MINISLSIIVPVYKDSYFAEKFINNVVTFIGSINLSYYEIIFVIDGGTRRTKEIGHAANSSGSVSLCYRHNQDIKQNR